MLGRDSEAEIWSRFLFELVIRTQPSGPLCLWQCFINISVSYEEEKNWNTWNAAVPSADVLLLHKDDRNCRVGQYLGGAVSFPPIFANTSEAEKKVKIPVQNWQLPSGNILNIVMHDMHDLKHESHSNCEFSFLGQRIQLLFLRSNVAAD